MLRRSDRAEPRAERTSAPAIGLILVVVSSAALIWLVWPSDQSAHVLPPSVDGVQATDREDSPGVGPESVSDRDAEGSGRDLGSGLARLSDLRFADPVDVEVRFRGRDLSVGRGRGVELLAGSAAAFGPVEGAHLLRVSLDDRTQVERVTFARDGRLQLALGAPRNVSGRVLGPDGQPVEGAEVDAGEWSDGERVTVRSNARGRFDLWAHAGAGVPIVVRSEGHADRLERIDLPLDGTAPGADPIEIRLGAASRLRVVSRNLPDAGAAEGGARPEVRLHLRPGKGFRPLHPYPFHRSGESGAILGANGIGEIRGLPERGRLELVCEHPALPEGAVFPVQLDPGSTTLSIGFASEAFPIEIDFRAEDSGSEPATVTESSECIAVRALRPARRGLIAPAAAAPGLQVEPLRAPTMLRLFVPGPESRLRALGRLLVGDRSVLVDWEELSRCDWVAVPSVGEIPESVPVVVGEGPDPVWIDPGDWRIRVEGRTRRVFVLGATSCR